MKSLVACSIVLGAIGVLFIVASMQDSSLLAVGIVLIAVDVLLILRNTVFKKKDEK